VTMLTLPQIQEKLDHLFKQHQSLSLEIRDLQAQIKKLAWQSDDQADELYRTSNKLQDASVMLKGQAERQQQQIKELEQDKKERDTKDKK
jgi:predicted  nucleic acid-binding Zn-ribbon protein